MTERINQLRVNAYVFEARAIIYRLSSQLYPKPEMPSNALAFINSSIKSLGRLSKRLTEEGKETESVRADVSFEITSLRFLKEYLQLPKKPFAADEIYQSLVPEFTPAEKPKERLSREIDPTGNITTGLKLIFRADPSWASFAFSQLPFDNIKLLPHDVAFAQKIGGIAAPVKNTIAISPWYEGPVAYELNLKDGRSKPIMPYKGSEPGTRYGFDTIAHIIAHETEHILFLRFLRGLFIYPIFTELCHPFQLDCTSEYTKARGFFRRKLQSLKLPTEDSKKCLIRAISFFSELRSEMREADIAIKIGYHYYRRNIEGKSGGGEDMMWAQNLARAKQLINLISKMIELAPKFELTEMGEAYLDGEKFLLRSLRSEYHKCKKFLEEAIERDKN